MNIKVWDDKYAIKSDAHCYRLVVIKEKTAGDDELGEVEEGKDGTVEVTVGYPSTVASAFRLIYEREARNNKCTTLDGYVKHLEKLDKKLEKNIEKFTAIVGGHEKVVDVMTRISKYNEGNS